MLEGALASEEEDVLLAVLEELLTVLAGLKWVKGPTRGTGEGFKKSHLEKL